MTAELVFYTNPMSRGRTARWMLEEVGAPYRAEILEFGTTMKSPEYLAINPMGRRGPENIACTRYTSYSDAERLAGRILEWLLTSPISSSSANALA